MIGLLEPGGQRYLISIFRMDSVLEAPLRVMFRTPPFGSSKRAVAQNRRAAAKRRAVRRARKHGHA